MEKPLGRRRVLALLGLAAVGAAIGREHPAGAGTPPWLAEDADHLPRRALQATAGPAVVPETIRLRLSNGTYCSMPFEEYLRGVVPSEVPASWPAEALKAQAVAARTYAAAYLATYGYICTTTACQAWDPSRQHAATDAAIDATRGAVLSYEGGLIWSYYSSTCGGQTSTSPDAASAYCRAVRCWREADGTGRAPLELSSEAAARDFWGSDVTPTSLCSNSGLFRWSWAASRTDQESILDRYMPSGSLTPRYTAGALGGLRDLNVEQRSSSGKVTRLRVLGGGGEWRTSSETTVRSLLRASPSAGLQYSANVVLTLEQDGGGIARVVGRGGGWGHSIGLCQFGARGLAARGYDYGTILTHYYSGVQVTRATRIASLQAPAARIWMPLISQGSSACASG